MNVNMVGLFETGMLTILHQLHKSILEDNIILNVMPLHLKEMMHQKDHH